MPYIISTICKILTNKDGERLLTISLGKTSLLIVERNNIG